MTPMTSLFPATPVRTCKTMPDHDNSKLPAESKEGLFESIRRLVAERGQEAVIVGTPEVLALVAVAEENGSEGEPAAGQECLDNILLDLTVPGTTDLPVILPTPIPRPGNVDEPGKSSAAVARNALEIHQSHPHSQALLHSRALKYSQTMQQAAPGAEMDAAPVTVLDGVIMPAETDSSHAYAAAMAEMTVVSEGKGTPSEKSALAAGKNISAALPTTAAAAAIEKPLASLSSDSGSSLEQEPSDDGKAHLKTPSHGQAVQAEHRPFAAAAMAANAIEFQGEDARVSSPQIVRQIVESMEYTPAAGVQEMVIRLKPDVFGELHIRLEMKDDAISARIVTDSHPTRVLLSSHLSQLQDALQDKGLSVKDIQVEYISQSTGDSPSGHPGGEPGRRSSQHALHSGPHPADSPEKPATPAWRTERTVRAGGLDCLA